jgi:hypothetical protein
MKNQLYGCSASLIAPVTVNTPQGLRFRGGRDKMIRS